MFALFDFEGNCLNGTISWLHVLREPLHGFLFFFCVCGNGGMGERGHCFWLCGGGLLFDGTGVVVV